MIYFESTERLPIGSNSLNLAQDTKDSTSNQPITTRYRRFNSLDMLRFANLVQVLLLLNHVFEAHGTSNHLTKPSISHAPGTPGRLQDTESSSDNNQTVSSFSAISHLASPLAHYSNLQNETQQSPNSTHSLTINRLKPVPQKQESSTASLAELKDGNYLLVADQDTNQYPELMMLRAEESNGTGEAADALDEKPIKTKRQAQIPTADWWTKISKPSRSEAKGHSASGSSSRDKTSRKQPSSSGEQVGSTKGNPSKKKAVNSTPATKRPSVYKEQPMNQNAILTIRNQLVAIRGQHKLLVTRSMRQLQQLDNRLIDSYKLCLKKKQPLYAGMLYRTRDFVVRMAKEVKHESKVLEAMTKQVQGVLRQKMTNKTLVGEYNRLMITSTEPSVSTLQQTVAIEEVLVQNNQQLQQSVKQVYQTKVSLPRAKKDTRSHTVEAQQQVADKFLAQDQPVLDDTTDITYEQGKKNFYPRNKRPSTNRPGQPSKQSHDTKVKGTGKVREVEQPTTRKPKSVKYTVSVNEMNLKKELNKIQDLIDRVNGSCYELTSVVDDIGRLFKLSLEYPSKKGSSSGGKINKFEQTIGQYEDASSFRTTSDERRLKKMFKSPVKIFMEKYGKLTMANLDLVPKNNNSDSIPTNLPEMKPLFESSSLVYTESTDPEFGFDYVMATSQGE